MKLTEILGIELPIIQSPMAGVQGSELAIAVCNAGGLGSLPAAMLSSDQLICELKELNSINKPYNVNFFCNTQSEYNQDEHQIWLHKLNPYYHEFSVDIPATNTPTMRQPFSQDDVDILAAYKPAVVSFHFGLPARELLNQVKAWGSVILSSATTVQESIWLQDNGADVIIAQGIEAGGHRGLFLNNDITTQMGTLSLLPQIIQATDLPVIAAGGIAAAKTVKAAIDLGASGVQIGTTYLLCSEVKTTEIHRVAIKAKNSNHTALTNVFSGRPARSIMNRLMREIGPICEQAPSFPHAGSSLMPLRACSEKLGKNDFTPLWSGQNNSGCAEISATQMTQLLSKNL